MMKDGMYRIDKMLELERENARLRQELKTIGKIVKRLEVKAQKKNVLGGTDLDLIYILAKMR